LCAAGGLPAGGIGEAFVRFALRRITRPASARNAFRFEPVDHRTPSLGKPYDAVPATIASQRSLPYDPEWFRNFLTSGARRGTRLPRGSRLAGTFLASAMKPLNPRGEGHVDRLKRFWATASEIAQNSRDSEPPRGTFSTRLNRSADAYIARRAWQNGRCRISLVYGLGAGHVHRLRGLCLATGRSTRLATSSRHGGHDFRRDASNRFFRSRAIWPKFNSPTPRCVCRALQ